MWNIFSFNDGIIIIVTVLTINLVTLSSHIPLGLHNISLH